MMGQHRCRRASELSFVLAAILAVSALGTGRATAQTIITKIIDAAGAGRGAAPLCCGDTGITQANNVASIDTSLLACSTNGGAISVENAWAQCFSGTDFPTEFTLQCVEIGVLLNTSPTSQDFGVDLRISALTSGCPPSGITFGDPAAGQTWHDAPAAFNVLHIQTITIPDGIDNGINGLLQFFLEPPLLIPAGAEILFELHAPSRAIADGGDGGAFRIGGNASGGVGEDYIWAPSCGLTSYELVLPTFPLGLQWVVRLEGTFSSIAPPAVDCNANGVPDECETDCNANGLPDDCDVDPLDPDGNGLVSPDCNANGIPDECDVDPADPDGDGQVSLDVDGNGIPDECKFPNQGLCCGDTGITQSNDVNDTSRSTAACLSGSVTLETAWARCFSSTDFPTDFTLQCVEFGVSINTSPTGQDFDLDFRISQLAPTPAFPSLTCPLPVGLPGLVFGDPQLGQTWFDAPPEFNVLLLQTGTIPDGASGLLQFFLEPPLVVPAGADILFELHAPSRLPADGGDGGAFHPAGSFFVIEVAQPYIWAPSCSLTDYQTFPLNNRWSVRLDGTFGPIVPPAVDCNANGVPDECETDCNANGIPDECDVDPIDPDGDGLVSPDSNGNGIPDECDPDCNANGIPDDFDVNPLDPDGNGLVSLDCNANGIPDECETDCNANAIPDDCDIDLADPDGNGLFSTDCNFNGIPDECDVDPLDPDGNGQVSADCQLDVIPDECQTDIFTYQLDDGTGDSFIGPPNGGNLAWMNRFTVRAGSETIGGIRLAWGAVADGTPATAYLWSDPNGDGDPTDAQVLASAATTVQDAGTNSFTNVAIPDTLVGSAGTIFFVGAIITHQAGEKPIPLNLGAPSVNTWFVTDGASPIDPNNLAAAASPPFVLNIGVALVRAVAPGDDCNNSGVPNICEGSDNVALFVGELTAAVPNPLLTCLFDANGDGTVNGPDIQPFVDGLLAGQ